jgi:hypothetical protein
MRVESSYYNGRPRSFLAVDSNASEDNREVLMLSRNQHAKSGQME